MEREELMNSFLSTEELLIETAINTGILPIEIPVDKDNKIYEKFQIRTPSFKEKLLAERMKDELRIELMKSKNYEFKNNLIKLYKEKGINIEDFDKEFEELQEKLNKKKIILAELKPQENTEKGKEKIEKVKKQITELFYKQMDCYQEKKNLLRYSIEDLCGLRYLVWLIIQCTDKYNEETKIFEQYYKDYEGWENVKDEKITNIISNYAGRLFYYKGDVINV